MRECKPFQATPAAGWISRSDTGKARRWKSDRLQSGGAGPSSSIFQRGAGSFLSSYRVFPERFAADSRISVGFLMTHDFDPHYEAIAHFAPECDSRPHPSSISVPHAQQMAIEYSAAGDGQAGQIKIVIMDGVMADGCRRGLIPDPQELGHMKFKPIIRRQSAIGDRRRRRGQQRVNLGQRKLISL